LSGAAMIRQTPVAPDLIDFGADGPRLVGGRRKIDGKIAFPLPSGGEREHYERITLNPHGALWSWTVQRFRPKTPPYAAADDETAFRPFVLGYVELPGEIIVEARIEADPETLSIGAPMELIVLPFIERADETIVTYAFRPRAGTGGSA
jgi:uncharacterized OB-fold protein